MIDIEHFAQVALRVGKVVEAEAVPKSKKLLKLQVDLGEGTNRQILSGIAQFYSPEELVGKHLVIVSNLKPAQFMGLDSNGMVLAVDTGERVTLVEVNAPPGSVVR
jgi:methionyl-tRNA synthetase